TRPWSPAAWGLRPARAAACRRAGHDVTVVSCGGTGTFPYCAQQPGVTEVQVGGAIFSDMHYLTHYHVDFAPALTVLTTVTSRPTPQRIVVDAGKKAMSATPMHFPPGPPRCGGGGGAGLRHSGSWSTPARRR